MNCLSLCSVLLLVVVCVQGQAYNSCPRTVCDGRRSPLDTYPDDTCDSVTPCCAGKMCCMNPQKGCIRECVPIPGAMLPSQNHVQPTCPRINGRCPARSSMEYCQYPDHRPCQDAFGVNAVCCRSDRCGDYCARDNVITGALGFDPTAPRY